jgi:hypothetical protein
MNDKRFVVHYFCRGECIDHQIVDFIDDGLIWAACIQNRCDGMTYICEELKPPQIDWMSLELTQDLKDNLANLEWGRKNCPSLQIPSEQPWKKPK